jgi:hypothetical protein
MLGETILTFSSLYHFLFENTSINHSEIRFPK